MIKRGTEMEITKKGLLDKLYAKIEEMIEISESCLKIEDEEIDTEIDVTGFLVSARDAVDNIKVMKGLQSIYD